MEFQRSPAHKNIDILSLYSSDNWGHFYWILEVEWISNEYHWRMLFSDKFKPFSIKGYDVCNSSPFSTNWDTLVILRPKNTKSNYKVLYNGKLVYEFRKKEFAQWSTDLISKKEDHKIPFMWEMIYIWESKVNFETLYIDTSTQRLVSVDRFKPNSFKIKGIIGDNEWTTVKILDDKYIEIWWKKFLKDLIKKIW